VKQQVAIIDFNNALPPEISTAVVSTLLRNISSRYLAELLNLAAIT